MLNFLLLGYLIVDALVNVLCIINIYRYRSDGCTLSPASIKDNLELNWFGTIIVFILMLIILPLVYLFVLFSLIFTSRLPDWFE